jgi:hypothetical protein
MAAAAPESTVLASQAVPAPATPAVIAEPSPVAGEESVAATSAPAVIQGEAEVTAPVKETSSSSPVAATAAIDATAAEAPAAIATVDEVRPLPPLCCGIQRAGRQGAGWNRPKPPEPDQTD